MPKDGYRNSFPRAAFQNRGHSAATFSRSSVNQYRPKPNKLRASAIYRPSLNINGELINSYREGPIFHQMQSMMPVNAQQNFSIKHFSNSKTLFLFGLMLFAAEFLPGAQAAVPRTSKSDSTIPEPGSVLVYCGPGNYLPAAIRFFDTKVELAQWAECNSKVKTIDPDQWPTNSSAEFTDVDFHCVDTLPFIYDPEPASDIRKECISVALIGTKDTSTYGYPFTYAQNKKYPILTASIGIALSEKQLLAAGIITAFNLKKNLPYSEIVKFLRDTLVRTDSYGMNQYQGLYITCSSQQEGGNGKVYTHSGPISLWNQKCYSQAITLIYTVSRSTIVVTSGPNENELYSTTSYAPGMIVLPKNNRKVYAKLSNFPAAAEFFAKKNEFHSNDGFSGNSFTAPCLVGFAARINKKFPELDAYSLKAIIYFHTIRHNYHEPLDGSKKGQNAGLRYLGKSQQKNLADSISSSHGNILPLVRYAKYCYERYEESGFNNNIYDKCIQNLPRISSKLGDYYQQWVSTNSKTRDSCYDKLVNTLIPG
jgi:hypothetical protein